MEDTFLEKKENKNDGDPNTGAPESTTPVSTVDGNMRNAQDTSDNVPATGTPENESDNGASTAGLLQQVNEQSKTQDGSDNQDTMINLSELFSNWRKTVKEQKTIRERTEEAKEKGRRATLYAMIDGQEKWVKPYAYDEKEKDVIKKSLNTVGKGNEKETGEETGKLFKRGEKLAEMAAEIRAGVLDFKKEEIFENPFVYIAEKEEWKNVPRNMAVAKVDLKIGEEKIKYRTVSISGIKVDLKESVGKYIAEIAKKKSGKNLTVAELASTPKLVGCKVHGYSRDSDSESKILEDILSKIEEMKPNSEKDKIEGEISLYTERECCESCSIKIKEFSERYPHIKIYVYEGEADRICKEVDEIKRREQKKPEWTQTNAENVPKEQATGGNAPETPTNNNNRFYWRNPNL